MDGSVERSIGQRIGVRNVATLRPGSTIWDTALIGFGARRRQGAQVSYIVVYRTAEGRQRLITVGRHGSPWTPEAARVEALRLLGEVARGGDPMADRRSRKASTLMTMSELCGRYLADIEAGRLMTRHRQAKKASTIRTDRSRVDAHIIPLIGTKPVATISRDDIEAMMRAIIQGTTRKRIKLAKPFALSNTRGGRGAASRTVGLLGGIMSYAVRLGIRTDNPVHGVVRPADGRRERRLQIEEYAALGDGLVAAGDDADLWAPGLAAIRFMVLTGWRLGEVLGLRWSEVDLARRTVRLADTKTGSSVRPIAEAACLILRAMSRGGERVFPAPGGDVPMAGFRRVWIKVVHRIAGLPADITPHILRHSYASLAADLGFADATIAGLLGHRGHTITRRYIHSADAALLAAADTVAAEITKLFAHIR